MAATLTITVPIDAAPGEQYGVIWAEAPESPVADSGVKQISRVGIRIYLSVGPGAAPAANFTIDALTAKRSPDGQPTVTATVHNTGGRALDMSGTLQLLNGPAGLSAGPFPAALGVTLGIGATAFVTIALDKQLPAGPWDAQITLHSGLLERSARARIVFPDIGASAPVKITTARSGWLNRLMAGVVLLLLGTTGMLVVRTRRRRPIAHLS